MTIQTGLSIIILTVAVFTLILVILTRKSAGVKLSQEDRNWITSYIDAQFDSMSREYAQLRDDVSKSVATSTEALGGIIVKNMAYSSEQQAARIAESLDASRKSLDANTARAEERFRTFSSENAKQLEAIRRTIAENLGSMREDNARKLDEMRIIVDEKLQKTLNARMNESFRLVNERLEQVYKGLGEMKTLAVGVGDLKKILSNVKTRGILGEVQLSAILAEILAPDQYDTNVATKRGSRQVVEFAIKIPVDETFMYMPVDSKFPGDTYAALREATENGDKAARDEALRRLSLTIRAEAKDIHDKYIDPPHTTEFAVMFLPFEGLYAEVVNSGMIEKLQREFQVCIAGPSTMGALLNSLQMGFRTFAIRQRSSEVWKVLGAVKTEFDKFEDALRLTQQRITQANDELDKLVGVRTRQIQKKLREVTELDTTSADIVIGDGDDVNGKGK